MAAGKEAGDYNKYSEESKDTHIDAAEFAKEMGDDSERHQEESRSDAEEITRVAKAALESMKRF